ncbi:MAG TPA: hypothetical protein VMU78_02400 [Methylocella sp.]|nr:hypothetical protein [Methylocella sp.]
MRLSRKQLQLLVSAVGTLLIVPWGLFLGVMFTFAFRADESRWAWGFDIVSFWLQIPPILVSFFKPRIAAWWMLANVSASVLIGLGFEIGLSFSPDARHLSIQDWVTFLPSIAKESLIFWGLPTLIALLLFKVAGTDKFSEPHRSSSSFD